MDRTYTAPEHISSHSKGAPPPLAPTWQPLDAVMARVVARLTENISVPASVIEAHARAAGLGVEQERRR